MRKKILPLLVIFILTMGTFNITTFAVQSVSDYQSQIEETKTQSEDAKQQLEQVEGEIDTALQEVEDINSSISKLESEVEEISKNLTVLGTSIEEKQKDLDEKQALLDERLSAAYMNENNTYLEAFFTGGLLNFISNYDMIKQIAQYDTQLMNEVKEVKKNLENEKIKQENAKIEKEIKSKELKSLKEEKEEKISNLTEEQKQIQSQIDEYDNQMKILEAKEKALVTQYMQGTDGTTQIGNSATSGTFLWPVPSSKTITSNYGYRIHPISGTNKLHAGLDIGAAGGADIVAAAPGTVYLSSFGYNGGYGNYIIIDHGNGVTTRYAHCSNLFVSVGDKVTKGQVIAAVGSTGASTGNHCHFEVRINGESQNPINYL